MPGQRWSRCSLPFLERWERAAPPRRRRRHRRWAAPRPPPPSTRSPTPARPCCLLALPRRRDDGNWDSRVAFARVTKMIESTCPEEVLPPFSHSVFDDKAVRSKLKRRRKRKKKKRSETFRLHALISVSSPFFLFRESPLSPSPCSREAERAAQEKQGRRSLLPLLPEFTRKRAGSRREPPPLLLLLLPPAPPPLLRLSSRCSGLSCPSSPRRLPLPSREERRH